MNFNEAVKARALDVAELVIRKQRDYGPNNIMRNHVRPELALAVRLSDKIARVVNLAEKGTDPSNEALQDTWMDIVGYGLIGLMVLNGEFELPLEPEMVVTRFPSKEVEELEMARAWWREVKPGVPFLPDDREMVTLFNAAKAKGPIEIIDPEPKGGPGYIIKFDGVADKDGLGLARKIARALNDYHRRGGRI